MNRREFVNWVGLGAIATSLPVAIAACSPQAEAPKTSEAPAAPVRADGFQPIGSVADLDKQGSLSAKLAAGPALVVRNPTDAKAVIAVNPTCPHKGCVVAWKTDEKAFVCPCHDAKFASDGKVTQSPADKPLATYMAKIEGDVVLVKPA
jgi:cytochrome b6-f complex iron-sulfur subunit